MEGVRDASDIEYEADVLATGWGSQWMSRAGLVHCVPNTRTSFSLRENISAPRGRGRRSETPGLGTRYLGLRTPITSPHYSADSLRSSRRARARVLGALREV